MSEWQPIATCPMNQPVLVAYHGRGENRVDVVTRTKQTGQWGDFDYINSHDGEPKWWLPIPAPPDDIAGPDCGCDGCTEQYADPDKMLCEAGVRECVDCSEQRAALNGKGDQQ